MEKIFIAIPASDGKLFDICVDSLFKNINFLREKGYDTVLYLHPTNIYVEKARNICVKKFLESDCTDMVFIDSDVGFGEDAIWKLFQYDKMIIGGIYPYKKDNLDFPAMIDWSNDNNCKEESTGLVYLDVITTGFLRIKREVFDIMLKNQIYKIQKDAEDIYNFFQTGILFDDDLQYYGEDVAFCRAWRMIGENIYGVPDIDFLHVGVKKWGGNFYNFLMNRKINDLDRTSGIRGWSTDTELAALTEFASLSDSVVEIGSWKGKSTKVLLENCKGTVYSVDTWNGSENEITGILAGCQDVFKEFLKNVGDYPNLVVYHGKSTDIAKEFDKKVDMVFIDGDHSYESVKADIESWLPKCKKIMCGHDYSLNYPGVIKAVNEKFDIKFKADTLWWVELNG